ncbi:MAG: hypothetical protein JJE36_00640 [Coriobacteriia bacterium]|nr:hypothetical protein [Coriobacteriia bacterium]
MSEMKKISRVDGFQFVNDRKRNLQTPHELCAEGTTIVSGHFALQTADKGQAEVCHKLKNGALLSIHRESGLLIPPSMEDIASKHGIDVENLRQKTALIRLKDAEGNILDILGQEASSAVVDSLSAGMHVEARVCSSEDMFDGWRIIRYRIIQVE